MNESLGRRTTSSSPGTARWAARLATRRTAWVMWAVALCTAAATALFAVLSRATARPDWHPWWLIVGKSLVGTCLALLGFLVATRRRPNPAGWLLLTAGCGASLDLFTHAYGLYAVPRGLPGGVLAMWATNWAFVFYTFPIMFLILLFPDGRLPSVRWRFVARYMAACAVLTVPIGAFMPGTIGAGYFPAISNPVGIEALSFTVTHVGLVSVITFLPPFLVAVSSLMFRYRSACGLARQQLKWVAWAVLVSVVLVVVHVVFLDGAAETIALSVVPVLLSAAIAVAIVRHNLFDIDRLLSNSLIYTGLTASVIGLYIGMVSALGLLFRDSTSEFALATGIVAILLQPLRTLLQRLVTRLVYGLRDAPYTALALLGRRLEATASLEDLLPAATSTVVESLRLPFAAIELTNTTTSGVERTCVTTHGTQVPNSQMLRLPMVHQGEEIGTLLVGARSAEEDFSAADLRLLGDAARHIAQAASAVRLSASLMRSRERAVAAAAEERRRLARDLHDGVGPVLTGATWTLQAATTKLLSDPDSTQELLTTALAHLRQGTEDLRRITVGLRSPADQLGLREAILASLEQVPLTVHTTLPDEMPPLAAAVEEAAYWILAEAAANVLRHADADNCWVHLHLTTTDLKLAITDDGKGLPARYRPGVGMGSMRERAAEIGGRCEIRSRAGGGAEVLVSLPFTLPGGRKGDQDDQAYEHSTRDFMTGEIT